MLDLFDSSLGRSLFIGQPDAFCEFSLGSNGTLFRGGIQFLGELSIYGSMLSSFAVAM